MKEYLYRKEEYCTSTERISRRRTSTGRTTVIEEYFCSKEE